MWSWWKRSSRRDAFGRCCRRQPSCWWINWWKGVCCSVVGARVRVRATAGLMLQLWGKWEQSWWTEEWRELRCGSDTGIQDSIGETRILWDFLRVGCYRERLVGDCWSNFRSVRFYEHNIHLTGSLSWRMGRYSIILYTCFAGIPSRLAFRNSFTKSSLVSLPSIMSKNDR